MEIKAIGIAWTGLAWMLIGGAQTAPAAEHGPADGGMMMPGLMMPQMNAEEGRRLFASKGCVVCHSVNGVGGNDAPPLDASTMPGLMNPFEFAARMWDGAEAMVYLQREEIGAPIALTGQELADIIAFVHDAQEQERFSESDVPERFRELLHHGEDEEEDNHMGADGDHMEDMHEN